MRKPRRNTSAPATAGLHLLRRPRLERRLLTPHRRLSTRTRCLCHRLRRAHARALLRVLSAGAPAALLPLGLLTEGLAPGLGFGLVYVWNAAYRVDGATNDAAQRVPGAVIKPVPASERRQIVDRADPRRGAPHETRRQAPTPSAGPRCTRWRATLPRNENALDLRLGCRWSPDGGLQRRECAQGLSGRQRTPPRPLAEAARLAEASRDWLVPHCSSSPLSSPRTTSHRSPSWSGTAGRRAQGRLEHSGPASASAKQTQLQSRRDGSHVKGPCSATAAPLPNLRDSVVEIGIELMDHALVLDHREEPDAEGQHADADQRQILAGLGDLRNKRP
jgi:hypothetical protein